MNPNLYKTICEKFIQFEADQNLLFKKIQNVYIWQVCRTIIFYNIIDQLIPTEDARSENLKFKKFLSLCYRFFVNVLIYNPFNDRRKSDVLIFESSRKYLRGKKYVDIYTKYLEEQLASKGVKTTTYEFYYNEKERLLKGPQHVKHLEALHIYAKIIQKFSKINLSQDEIVEIEKLQIEITQLFNISIDLKSIILSQIYKFNSEIILYDRLLKIKKPKEIYIISSADKAALVAAAKQNNIIVNELQHGLNSNISIVSNYPLTEKDSLLYFPTHFYVWNNVNMFSAILPLKDENIMYIPHYHLDILKEQTDTICKEVKTILFVSQPYGSAEIQQYLVDNIDDLKDYTIYYKIHPVENLEKIKALQSQLKNYTNLKFIDNEQSIYVLMKRANYVIGIYSSALFEAVIFDCKIILLNLPGVEFSTSLLDDKKAILVETNQTLIKFLK